MRQLGGESSPNWPFAIGYLPFHGKATQSHTAAKAEGRMQNAETRDKAIPSPLQAPLRPSGSQPVGTRKPPSGYPEATLRLPRSYPEATLRLPRGSTKATLNPHS